MEGLLWSSAVSRWASRQSTSILFPYSHPLGRCAPKEIWVTVIPYCTVTFESILCLTVNVYKNPLRPELLRGEKLEDLGGFSFHPFYVGVCGSQARKHYVCQLLTRCPSQEKSHLFKTSPGSSRTLRQVKKKHFQSKRFYMWLKCWRLYITILMATGQLFWQKYFYIFFIKTHIK